MWSLPRSPGAEESGGVGGKNPACPRRTQFLCSILRKGVRKARVLGGGRKQPQGRLAGYIRLVNAQYTSYTGTERTENSAVSVSRGASLHRDQTFCLIPL